MAKKSNEEINGILQGIFAGADLSGAQIIAYNDGEVVYNKFCDDRAKTTLSEDNIVNAINELMAARDEQGVPIFTDKAQWYAVYRVLQVYANYPEKMTQFKTKMNDLGFNEENKLTYDSLVSASKATPKIARIAPEAWNPLKDINQNYSKQYVVADFLMCKLGIKG